MTLASSDFNADYTRERLFTPEGGFVAEVNVPVMEYKPDVLIWGARVFLRLDSYELVEFEREANNIEGAAPEGCYIEAFAYHIPPEAHHSTKPGGLDQEPPILPISSEQAKEWEEDAPYVRPLPVPDHFEQRRRAGDRSPDMSDPGEEVWTGKPEIPRSVTLRLAIEDAERRIASNPEDANYVKIQTGKIRAWQAELNRM